MLGLENGEVSCTDRNFEGSVCTFTCNSTHALAGRSELVCQTENLVANWTATDGDYLQAPVCHERCSDALDIVVVLDSSSSIGNRNFELMRGFLQSLVSKMSVSADKVRIAAIRYNRQTHFLWDFDDYTNIDTMKTAIADITYDGKGTHTGKALTYVRQNLLLTTDAGARDNVAKVVVVITDGKSQDEVSAPAQLLKSMNVLIAVVGIGNVDLSQISTIASEPNSDFVTTVSDFGSLDLVVQGISKKISLCQDMKENLCPSDPVVDLLFIVDSSSSVRADNFEKMKEFLKYVVSHFAIGPNKAQVGVIRYNSKVDERFTLAQYSSNEAVENAITAMPYNGKGTKTAQALLHAARNSLNARAGRRPGVPAVVVVITDGKAQDSSNLLANAELLQSKANVVAIGIKGAKIDQLNEIATDPDEKSVFSVFDFSALNGIIDTLKNAVCLSTRTGMFQDLAHLNSQE